MRRGVICALVLCGLAPGVASARILRAEGILPPGQSGFVSPTGVTSGTGSPHLYDQLQPFIDFRRKPLGFDQPGTSESPRPGVTIVRDAYGVPRINAGSSNDVWWGAGYAVAQDRLFQLELFRRATTGRLAEILGKSYLDDDLIARRDYYTPAEMDAMLDALPIDLRQRFDAYRDGINAWIEHVKSTPGDLPGEFAAVGLPGGPTPWTDRDSTGVGIFLARTVPSGDGNELNNLKAVKQKGAGVLDALLPIRVPGQVTTIPRAEGLFSQGRQPSRAQRSAAARRSLGFAATLPVPTPAAASASIRKRDLPPGMIGKVGGSSMFAVRTRDHRHAYMFNGPQLGFSVPELFVELELHGPGLDVRGVTAPGVPVIGIGHNSNVAWGFTSGLSDEDDLYAERVTAGQPERYTFRGAQRSMSCRDEVFNYQSPPTDLIPSLGDLAPPAPPESGAQTERICRTVHGPVQLRVGSVAYARRYAIWGREVETLKGIADLNAARNVYDVDRAMRRVTWNENVIAADSQGNIGFWHPGLFQLRPFGWDERLPYPGTGEAEWRGLLDRRRTPHVINPKQGWLANWNNVPSTGWTSGDGESTERLSGTFHRAHFFMNLVRGVARAPSFAAAERAVRIEGTFAQQRSLDGPRLRAAARRARGKAAVVLGAILAWDGSYARTGPDGTIDPGAAAWQEFKLRAARVATVRFGDTAELFGVRTSAEHVYDISDVSAYGLRTLGPKGYRLAAAIAFDALRKRFGTSDPKRWRDKRAMFDIAVQGAGNPPPLPFFDRGTWEQIVEVGR